MDKLKHFVKHLTTSPGVYQMVNSSGKILYVGKAKNLRSRVGSYFSDRVRAVKTLALVRQIHSIEITVTASENEALLLEANLIKRLRPRYNVLMRDDKSYPYLYLSTQHDFPSLDLHRGAKKKKGQYFGPYPSVTALRDNLNLLQKLFKIRQCSNSFFSRRKRPCLQYQIKRCTAPCVGYVSQEDYAQQISQVRLFLAGKNEQVAASLQAAMQQYSQQRQYELAAQYRDKIQYLREILQQQNMQTDLGDVDVFSLLSQGGLKVIVVLFIRAGRVLGNKHYILEHLAHLSEGDILSEFLSQYYINPVHQHPTLQCVVVNCRVTEKVWLESALQGVLNTKLRVIDKAQGKYRCWCDLAEKNAQHVIEQTLSTRGQFMQKLSSLQHALSLPQALSRLECFDISHTSGQLTVASCVVFDENGARKHDYRSFNIRDITPGDDYAAMYQALLRHYTRLKKNDGALPDLLIIDGGKGQLAKAAQVMEELQIPGVILLGVAKGRARKPGEETLHLHGRTTAVHLAADSESLHCLQIVRDEAHRFAITKHRKKRAKAASRSDLEQLPGIGAKRRQALLVHFGGWQQLIKASEADIAKVPGIGPKLAKTLHNLLH